MADNFLYLTKIGIDTYQHAVVFMRKDCHVCRAEGFNAMTRVRVCTDKKSITATLITVSEDFLSHKQAGLSDVAWKMLGAEEGEVVQFSHAPAVDSMSYVRGKLYGEVFTDQSATAIVEDIKKGNYSDVQLAAFVAACADDRLNLSETIALTRAMVDSGERFYWSQSRVLDKHCVGGLPGNRTTPIVTAIIAANGFTMPKTSSRAITSPAGTADTMETMTPVTLSFEHMKTVVEQQGACLAWGGSVSLSPIDDIVIRIERALDLDSEGQLVASVISKKVAAGSSHVLIDIPVGPSAKVRTHGAAEKLSHHLIETGAALGLHVETIITDGNQPVGRGIGPALEAHDVLAVLRNEKNAPQDLIERALILAARLLKMANQDDERLDNKADDFYLGLAKRTLESGQAYEKFLTICQAQGGFKEPGVAPYQQTLFAGENGIVSYFNNRFIAKFASLAGAPNAALAGLQMHVRLGDKVERGQALLTLHAQAQGELDYALEFYHSHPEAIQINKEVL
ncbi:MAG: thymidine phosphorylase family protein [Oleispira sp.]|nr:thymidine phosphorylase family protein [Oleispira sp.]